MTVVTMSSLYGAGARDVGRLVAERLGLQYVDQAVLVETARNLGVTFRRVVERDERIESLRERLSNFFQRALERSAAGGTLDPMLGSANLEMMLAQSYAEASADVQSGVVDDRAYLEAITQVLRDVAARGDVVILGRGGQMVLRDWPDAVHVQLVADEEVRLQRVQAWEGLDGDEVRRRTHDFNAGRAAFHKKFWKVDVWDPTLYDVVINTTTMDYATVAEIACCVVQAKLKRSAAV